MIAIMRRTSNESRNKLLNLNPLFKSSNAIFVSNKSLCTLPTVAAFSANSVSRSQPNKLNLKKSVSYAESDEIIKERMIFETKNNLKDSKICIT